MKNGDMFLFIPQGVEREYMSTEIYVKMHDDTVNVQGCDASRFIKNSALVKTLISNYGTAPRDIWSFTDKFFNELMEANYIFPIKDLQEAEAICKERGVDMPDDGLPE